VQADALEQAGELDARVRGAGLQLEDAPVRLDRVLDPADARVGAGELAVGGRVLWALACGVLEGVDGLVVLAGAGLRDAEVEQGDRIAGPQPREVLERRRRLDERLDLHERVASELVGLGVLREQAGGLAEGLGRALRLAEVVEEPAQLDVRLRAGGGELHGLLEARLRVGRAVQLLHREAEREVCLGVVGVDPGGVLERLNGLAGATQLEQAASGAPADLAVVLLQPVRLLEGVDGELVLPRVGVDHPEQALCVEVARLQLERLLDRIRRVFVAVEGVVLDAELVDGGLVGRADLHRALERVDRVGVVPHACAGHAELEQGVGLVRLQDEGALERRGGLLVVPRGGLAAPHLEDGLEVRRLLAARVLVRLDRLGVPPELAQRRREELVGVHELGADLHRRLQRVDGLRPLLGGDAHLAELHQRVGVVLLQLEDLGERVHRLGGLPELHVMQGDRVAEVGVRGVELTGAAQRGDRLGDAPQLLVREPEAGEREGARRVDLRRELQLVQGEGPLFERVHRGAEAGVRRRGVGREANGLRVRGLGPRRVLEAHEAGAVRDVEERIFRRELEGALERDDRLLVALQRREVLGELRVRLGVVRIVDDRLPRGDDGVVVLVRARVGLDERLVRLRRRLFQLERFVQRGLRRRVPPEAVVRLPEAQEELGVLRLGLGRLVQALRGLRVLPLPVLEQTDLAPCRDVLGVQLQRACIGGDGLFALAEVRHSERELRVALDQLGLVAHRLLPRLRGVRPVPGHLVGDAQVEVRVGVLGFGRDRALVRLDRLLKIPAVSIGHPELEPLVRIVRVDQ
jgi:hypothetical protein